MTLSGIRLLLMLPRAAAAGDIPPDSPRTPDQKSPLSRAGISQNHTFNETKTDLLSISISEGPGSGGEKINRSEEARLIYSRFGAKLPINALDGLTNKLRN
jgi:hypothetical protein